MTLAATVTVTVTMTVVAIITTVLPWFCQDFPASYPQCKCPTQA